MFFNSNIKMLSFANSCVTEYGLDNTGKILYKFDSYGFREGNNYDIHPSVIFFGSSYLAGIGVNINERFTHYIDNSWNFGLFGEYNEEQSLANYQQFKKNFPQYAMSKIVFCWKSTDDARLLKLIKSTYPSKNLYHTIPTNLKLKDYNLLRIIENVDYDVSRTHYGPITHHKFSKILWHFLK